MVKNKRDSIDNSNRVTDNEVSLNFGIPYGTSLSGEGKKYLYSTVNFKGDRQIELPLLVDDAIEMMELIEETIEYFVENDDLLNERTSQELYGKMYDIAQRSRVLIYEVYDSLNTLRRVLSCKDKMEEYLDELDSMEDKLKYWNEFIPKTVDNKKEFCLVTANILYGINGGDRLLRRPEYCDTPVVGKELIRLAKDSSIDYKSVMNEIRRILQTMERLTLIETQICLSDTMAGNIINEDSTEEDVLDYLRTINISLINSSDQKESIISNFAEIKKLIYCTEHFYNDSIQEELEVIEYKVNDYSITIDKENVLWNKTS